MTSTEQTIEPSEVAVDISDPLEIPAGTWASDSPDYVFSDVPQGVNEQWLALNYPDLWAQGVRAVTTDAWTVPNIKPAAEGDKGTPGALVAYVGGVKYEGTVDLPLRFQPAVTDGTVLSSASIDAAIDMVENKKSSYGIDTGYNSYRVTLCEHDALVARPTDTGNSDYPTSVKITSGPDTIGRVLTFDTKDEAIAYVMGGVTPKVSGETRVLNPGEISIVGLVTTESNGHSLLQIFDSRTGTWTTVSM